MLESRRSTWGLSMISAPKAAAHRICHGWALRTFTSSASVVGDDNLPGYLAAGRHGGRGGGLHDPHVNNLDDRDDVVRRVVLGVSFVGCRDRGDVDDGGRRIYRNHDVHRDW